MRNPHSSQGSRPADASSSRGAGWLIAATVVYLALPVIIFLFGWLKPHWGVMSSMCVIGAMWPLLARPFMGMPVGGMPKAWQVGLILGVVALVVGTQGPGGYGVQSWDWIKHNAVLRDLMIHKWPVIYETRKEPVALIYYVAYYLPAALLGKLLGWEAANLGIYGWTVVGCFLAGVWLHVLSGARWWLALIMLFFFSGWDLIGDAFRHASSGSHVWIQNFDAEWWNKLWTLPSNLTLMAYAPHQGIAGWLLTSLLVAALRDPLRTPPVGGIFALSILWSPLVTIGLGLLAAAWTLAGRVPFAGWVRRQVHLANLAAFLLIVVLGLYFQCRQIPVRLPPSLRSEPEVVQKGEFYLTAKREGSAVFLAAYARTFFLEYGPICLLLIWALRRASMERSLAVAVLVVLLALPWFHYGRFNDLVMRVCIPPLFALQILSLQLLAGSVVAPSRHQQRAQAALVVILLLGALYPLNMLRITVGRFEKRSWQLAYIPPKDAVPDLFQQQRQTRELLYFIGQYVGSPRSIFFTHLAKPHLPATPGGASSQPPGR